MVHALAFAILASPGLYALVWALLGDELLTPGYPRRPRAPLERFPEEDDSSYL